MNAWRRFTWFGCALTLIALIALGEGWCIFERVQAAKKSQLRLTQKRRELASVSSIEPAPTKANATAIEEDLARTTRALETMRASLQGRGPAADALRSARAPERRTDAFFDIAAFVEENRERAGRLGIAVGADERFGFAEYANAGPETELISAVYRQRLIAQHLLGALFESRPQQLVGVQRERPRAKSTADAAALRNGGETSSPDYFEIDPRVSARVPEFVETTAFRLTFVGPTAVLRAFLNKLAGFELPLVVRSVEVEPAPVAAASPNHGPDAPPEPLIRRTYSRFTVTVEFVELLAAPN